ncbi:phage capsid protein (plasmid) [Piscirickettsia salmonis]|nr:phage major capsid protein [Piscirickettsia salmonis]APS52337.1 phage capsid protein [Piscirickettsia salmonis]APS55638.1 phage capsid protein [Piscirickettsia salmonis]APS58815.1 phage capsid protein [Piscirickettsia salmonis]ERL62193.1 phage major capsid protein, HK97 family [Piscirickettsia salmonis LF-89 = ATCC VR-1361]QGN96755.1 phage major capsid protein, HK97 family [Piscirickettsia salmonis]
MLSNYFSLKIMSYSSDYVEFSKAFLKLPTFYIQPDFKSGEGDLLRGKRVNTSDFMDTLAAGKCAALFGDFSNFIIADRGGISLRRLNELYAETGEVGYLMWLRVDALLLETDAIKQLKTAAT